MFKQFAADTLSPWGVEVSGLTEFLVFEGQTSPGHGNVQPVQYSFSRFYLILIKHSNRILSVPRLL